MKNKIDFGFFDFHLAHIKEVENCTLEQACKMAVKCGCSWIECSFNTLTEERIKLYHDSGLRISSIFCFLNFEQDVDARIHSLLEMARKAAPKFVMPIPEKDNTPELRQKIIPCLIRLQKELAELNIQMVLEDFDGPNKSFATSHGLLAMLDAVPGLKCCFDTGNFYYSGEDVHQVFPLFADKIVHCHFKDRRLDEAQAKFVCTTVSGVKMSYCATGEGILPLREIFFDLLDSGYQGSIIVEEAMCYDPLAMLQRSVATLKNWYEIRR